jgi:phosphoribosylaminoimidazolecarboxamide formyltransferase/IMP cyclohydrolase
MDGRVKTLHPKLYAGLLAVRDDARTSAGGQEHEVEFVDLVCVNLYPFERTAASAGRRGRGDREHRHRRPDDDPRGRQELRLRRAGGQRRRATTPCSPSCASPAALSLLRPARAWPPRRSPTPRATTPRSPAGSRRSTRTSRRCSCGAYEKELELPYGENPHQRAAYYSQVGRAYARALDGQPARRQGALVQQPARSRRRAPAAGRVRVPACVIVKHNNPCGTGVGDRRSRPTSARSPATRCRRSAASCA